MTNIVSMASKQIKNGEPMFLLCPKCQDESMFMPIALQGKNKQMFISQLVCYGTKCHGIDIEDGNETVVDLLNGYIQEIK